MFSVINIITLIHTQTHTNQNVTTDYIKMYNNYANQKFGKIESVIKSGILSR